MMEADNTGDILIQLAYKNPSLLKIIHLAKSVGKKTGN
jgi:hypothetical protein